MSTLKKNGSTSAWRKIRAAVISRDMNSCTNCGRDDIKLEVDHIIGRAQGGTDNMDNLQTLCTICHKNKSAQVAFFLSTEPPLPIAWPLSLQKRTSRPHLSDIVRIAGDDCFDV
jgi:hypothetical protein